MEQLAPAPIVLTACLSTSPGQRLRRDQQIVAATPLRSVSGTPAQFDEVTGGVGFRLTARTVGAHDDGGTRLDEVRHVPNRANPVECFISWDCNRGTTRSRGKFVVRHLIDETCEAAGSSACAAMRRRGGLTAVW